MLNMVPTIDRKYRLKDNYKISVSCGNASLERLEETVRSSPSRRYPKPRVAPSEIGRARLAASGTNGTCRQSAVATTCTYVHFHIQYVL